jgi:hypothetical protein
LLSRIDSCLGLEGDTRLFQSLVAVEMKSDRHNQKDQSEETEELIPDTLEDILLELAGTGNAAARLVWADRRDSVTP